jgi:Transposase DDE domain
MDIVTLFCDIDDFCLQFEPLWHQHCVAARLRYRQRTGRLGRSEVMTIVIWFHLSGYRNLKTFYLQQICQHYTWAFPRLVSYTRFVELQREALIPLCAYLQTRKGQCSGLAFIDATALKVCHNRRIFSHRVFRPWAARGKTSVDWFYGFKLHLVINDEGELLGFRLTPGNVDDRAPVPKLVKGLWGKLFGDKGYISQHLFKTLFTQRLQLVTKLARHMKNKLLPLFDRLLLRKRAIIETVHDQLKNISQIEHSRHRSFWNFCGNVLAGLIAYTWREKKPSLGLRVKEQFRLPAIVL